MVQRWPCRNPRGRAAGYAPGNSPTARVPQTRSIYPHVKFTPPPGQTSSRIPSATSASISFPPIPKRLYSTVAHTPCQAEYPPRTNHTIQRSQPTCCPHPRPLSQSLPRLELLPRSPACGEGLMRREASLRPVAGHWPHHGAQEPTLFDSPIPSPTQQTVAPATPAVGNHSSARSVPPRPISRRRLRNHACPPDHCSGPRNRHAALRLLAVRICVPSRRGCRVPMEGGPAPGVGRKRAG